MPEGDTIFRAARTLNRALAGQTVSRFETVLPQLSRIDDDAPIAGRTIESVSAAGKWMHMQFSGGLVLVTHMLMSGSWHIYRPGERWKRPRFDMRIVIETPSFVAVAFHVPIAEFQTAASLARHRSVQKLGPDVLAPDFDAAAAIAQLRSRPDLEVGVALLRQSLVAGLGNVFKSEVCFAARVNPFRLVGSLSIQELAALMAHARQFMQANTNAGMRRTTGRTDPSERLWVYRRRAGACRVCGEAIRAYKQGEDARITFWCPNCQPVKS